ncbi:hypothetical protein fHeYen801_089 [Yersinia phage fHe-Yen8-01]|nr:hypothetical protein fHeYen801_089 [Yersinia phage fHe-Yen8-01]
MFAIFSVYSSVAVFIGAVMLLIESIWIPMRQEGAAILTTSAFIVGMVLWPLTLYLLIRKVYQR